MTDHPRIEDVTALLEAIVDDRSLLADTDPELRQRFLMAAGRVTRPDGKARRKLNKAQQKNKKVAKRTEDRALLQQTGIRKLRENPVFQTPRRRGEPEDASPSWEHPPLGNTHEERICYVCQDRFTEVHWFYDQMCPSCGDLNHKKRTPTANLTGRVALVTGARLKIGYQAAIMLLRSGAEVIVLTRFPVDAAARYSREADFSEWEHRLSIHGIDLRHTPSVEALCTQLLSSHSRLDLIINNACQTVRRPPGFYGHLMDAELTGPVGEEHKLIASQRSGTELPAAALSQLALTEEDRLDPAALFPADRLDADLQQVDLRKVNSWRLQAHEVSTIELLETQLVNAVAPFILNARLKPLMAAVPTNDAHIVNVSAMEGQFYRTFKSDRHPHTNMAKAALNMLTRTSAADFVEHGIHMNSVDTGWVTDEDPAQHAEQKRQMHDFHPPLDIVDGAARIVDPFYDGLTTGEHQWGTFLKDYRVTDW